MSMVALDTYWKIIGRPISSWGYGEEEAAERCMALLMSSIFYFVGSSVVESERVGWVGWWGGAFSFEDRNVFLSF